MANNYFGSVVCNGTGIVTIGASAAMQGSAVFLCTSDTLGVLDVRPEGVSSLTTLSGVVVNQNAGPDDWRATPDWHYQEFFLPPDYARGNSQIIPDLTGFQLLVSVDEGYADTASLDWIIQEYILFEGWQTMESGTEIGAHADGDRIWYDVYFKRSIILEQEDLDRKFRFGFKARSISGSTHNEIVTYTGKTAFVGSTFYNVTLEPGVPFPIEHEGVPCFLLLDLAGHTTVFSVQQGINRVWETYSPLPDTVAYEADGLTTITHGGNPTSFNFRVLAAIADSGVDFLGNSYRSAVVRSKGANITPFDANNLNNYWLSKPNPSRFAIESLYFDMRDNFGRAQVVDRILLDPITPGVFFNIYYSNEPGTPLSEYGWEQKLWTHVPKTFRAARRDSFALPEPITATFVKVEFTQLQAQTYQPRDFQLPVNYKKHPKWVLDYFLLRLEAEHVSQDDFIARQTDVQYSALDIAYNYYLDDLHEEPDQPILADPSQIPPLADEDLTNSVDSETLARISTTLRPYEQNPALRARLEDLFGTNNLLSFDRSLDYPVEAPLIDIVDSSSVSTTNRDAVVFENGYPVTYFFINARHSYRELTASFSHDRAYFAGVREIAFSRDHFTTVTDASLYIETIGDTENVERNDFLPF